jgi:S-adenosylmethionine synthetase
VVIAGEVKTKAWIDLQEVARNTVARIGYIKAEYQFDSKSCAVISSVHEQSPDINQGVERATKEEQGAGDQGMMFGYAITETETLMPLTSEIAHDLLYELAEIRREGKVMTYLRPDSKSQVTLEYSDEGKPIKIDTLLISTQHDEFDEEKAMQQKIAEDVKKYLVPKIVGKYPEHLFNGYRLLVNPTGKFVIGGPHGDTGLTGRKIIVDTYGGHGAHGGGAFSGKDASKVDRSGAYAARHMAKNMVAAGVADQILVQVAYAIGVSKPVGFYANTYGTAKVKDENGNIMGDSQIAGIAEEIFDMRPFAIIKRFGLKNPVFERTAAYGHFGRDVVTEEQEVFYKDETTTFKEERNGQKVYTKPVKFFAWEELDYVDKVKEAFKLA